MGRSRSHRALSASAVQTPSSGDRVAELEAQLRATQQELESARAAHQEDSAGFAQTLSRLTQSERSLSQTRAKLVEAEAKYEPLLAQLKALRELAESLSHDSAAGTEECAKLNEALHAAEARITDAESRVTSAQAREAAADARANELETRLAEAEARERDALIAAEEARDERAAVAAELEAVRSEQGDSGEARRQLAAAEARLDTLTHERVRLLELFASLEVLGREITHLTEQATPASPALPKVEAWLGRDVEAEHVRATLRPEGFSAPPQASRTWSTPEIVIDGMKVES